MVCIQAFYYKTHNNLIEMSELLLTKRLLVVQVKIKNLSNVTDAVTNIVSSDQAAQNYGTFFINLSDQVSWNNLHPFFLPIITLFYYLSCTEIFKYFSVSLFITQLVTYLFKHLCELFSYYTCGFAPTRPFWPTRILKLKPQDKKVKNVGFLFLLGWLGGIPYPNLIKTFP